jgi:hypothetical protein
LFSLSALVFGSALCLVFSFLSLLPSSLSFSLPFFMASTPPTSPQCSQAVGHHAECASRTLGSLEQCPSAPSAAAATLSLPFRGPVTFQVQTYYNLSANLVAKLANIPSLSISPRRRLPSYSCPCEFTFIFIKFILNIYIIYDLQMNPPPVPISRPLTLAPSTSITRRHSAMPLLAPAPVSFNYLLLFRH